MAKQSMYDWQADILKKDLPKLAKAFNINRQEDDERLANSGLPYFHQFTTSYQDFNQQNPDLVEFISDYKEFMIRALPTEKGLPRTYKRGGLFTLEDCKEFLDYTFTQNPDYIGKQKSYDIKLAETEIKKAGGVIISTPEKVLIEIKKERKIRNQNKMNGGLSGLCYGANPDQTIIIDLTGLGHIDDKTTWMQDKPELSKIMLRALDYLKLSGKDDNFNPHYMRGYFEFVQTKLNRIVFWDFKNQAFFQR